MNPSYALSFPFDLKIRGYRLLLLALALALVAGCASRPKQHQAKRTGLTPLVNYALSFQGTPYRWGEETPENGFDCSGFVQYVYGRHGYVLPRTAYQMANALPVVDEYSKQPGDLVFFNTTGKPYSHVGIYIGGNSFVHASSAGGRVMISSLEKPFWTTHFLGVRRPGSRERYSSAYTR